MEGLEWGMLNRITDNNPCVSCDTIEQAYADNDIILEALLLRCKERGITLKKKGIKLRLSYRK